MNFSAEHYFLYSSTYLDMLMPTMITKIVYAGTIVWYAIGLEIVCVLEVNYMAPDTSV